MPPALTRRGLESGSVAGLQPLAAVGLRNKAILVGTAGSSPSGQQRRWNRKKGGKRETEEGEKKRGEKRKKRRREEEQGKEEGEEEGDGGGEGGGGPESTNKPHTRGQTKQVGAGGHHAPPLSVSTRPLHFM